MAMDYERLWAVAESARDRRSLTPDDARLVRDEVPRDLAGFPRIALPKSIKHPAGFSLSGAPVGTFLRSALLLAGRKALGNRYGGNPFYEDVERDLAFGIMRSNFHHGYPKGAHCCQQCTLAVYPVLRLGAIRYFDCAELAEEVRRLVRERKWRFSSAPNPKLLRWSLGND
jgi:hypothetical protein